MEKKTYIIWKDDYSRTFCDVSRVVGLFHGTFEEADALLARLNAADPTVQEGFGRKLRNAYWRSEPTVIDGSNVHEFLDF